MIDTRQTAVDRIGRKDLDLPGRKYVLDSAHTRRTSLRTPATFDGTMDSRSTIVNMMTRDIGIAVDRRIFSGIGRDGVVTRIEGIARRSVIALSDVMNDSAREPGASC